MSEKMKEVNDKTEENFEKKIKRMSEMKTEWIWRAVDFCTGCGNQVIGRSVETVDAWSGSVEC